MGKIKKILENELIGGTQSTDVYPVTSTKAVYDENNERLDNILNRRGVVNISTNYNSEHTAEVLTLAQALSKVPSTDRVLGFQGKYLASDGWHTIIYTGDSLTSWSDTTKWIDLLDKILRSISKNATFAGIATPTTNPGTPDGPVFYIAAEPGVYANFSGITVDRDEAVILVWNNGATWEKEVSGFASSSYLKDEVAKLKEVDNEIQESIIDIKTELHFTEPKIYKVEGTAGYFQPSERIVCNTGHIWKKDDKLTAVLLGTKPDNSNLIHSYLRVYSVDKVLKGNYDLGAFNTSGIQQIDVSDLNIILDDGDLVGVLHAWWYSSPGSENYYDINSDTILSGYVYRIGFVFERKVETLKESIQQIKIDLYGSLELTTSSEWNEGFLITHSSTIGPGLDGLVQLDSPNTHLPGWHYKIIECKPGDKFTVHIKGGAADGRAWSFLYADRRVISQSSENTWLDIELIAPEEASYLILNANNETSTVEGEPPIWRSDEGDDIHQIKILCFGNSFTQDSMSYVPFMLKNLAPNIKLTLGIAYIAGCPLVQHLANFTGGDQTLDSVVYTKVNYTYYKSVNGGAWTSQNSKDVDSMIADEKWDIITFQQNGMAAYKDWDTYFAPFIFKLHKSVFDKIGYGVKIGWLLTQGAYASNYDDLLNNWQGTADNSKKMLEVTGTTILFPFGTAVQNLRTTSLKEIGDGAAHNLTADTAGHLQEGIGCMTAAYANTLVILNHLGIDKTGVVGEQTRIDSTFITEKNIPGPNLGTSGVVGVTNNNCYLAQVAAECAVKKPYEVTDLSAVESGI